MTLDKIDLFNNGPLLLRENLQDSATLAPLLSIHHHDKIILLDMKFLETHFTFRSSLRIRPPLLVGRQDPKEFKEPLEREKQSS